MNLTDIFVNKLKIESKVVSIDSLFNDESKVRKTHYNPPYQRNYVWDSEKATYFLESILIGTEIPPLIFFRSEGRIEIIDGRQRYETILRFLHDELKLKKSGLKKLDVLNIDKRSFSDLSDDLKNDFLDTKLRIIEYSFHSRNGLAKSDEDSVKQEIFKRYNSGITPLKINEIDKAIYFEDDLNSFFKGKLKDSVFSDLFIRLFRYEDKKVDFVLKKIRQLLVLHKIPIKYYSIEKQDIVDKYYDLLSSNIQCDYFEKLFDSFVSKLYLINEISLRLEHMGVSYNRLMSETLFWAFSILEDNGFNLPSRDSSVIVGFSNHLLNNIGAFKTERSSFSYELVTRYRAAIDYLEKAYGINSSTYIDTSDEFKKTNKELRKSQNTETVNYQELRINKPEPSTNTIDDICRQMLRSRFLVRPPYQREEVINKKKSSEIIESLLLGIKLPPIYIFKNEKGISEVIDGQQRILSILAFLGRSYVNENGEQVKSNKDGFSLFLKDSILKHLHGKRFDQLDEEQQDKITNFDLWVIEINHKNNINFEPLDLFIRLNNKPYPIKDDTFEMWNSYIDRGLIDTIKTSYQNSSSWFFMRKKGNRMENENNYTVLSYFNYLDLKPEPFGNKLPFDIYKIGSRINFRLRSKGDISKVLEDADKKEEFLYAINHFELSFISNLKVLLTDDGDDSDKTLSKNLDEILVVENGKRTQQSFYALWHFISGLKKESFQTNAKQMRREVRELFLSMSSDISTVEFDKQVAMFREKYDAENKDVMPLGKLDYIATITALDVSTQLREGCEYIYIKRDNKVNNRLQVSFFKPNNIEEYYACCLEREGFTIGYILALLRSALVYKENDFGIRNVTMSSLKEMCIPLLPLYKQQQFDKILIYTQTQNLIQSMFFENLLDKMIEEVFHSDLFGYQNVSLFDNIDSLEDLSGIADDQLNERVDYVYNEIVKDNEGLLSDLSAATGITSSLYYEKNN